MNKKKVILPILMLASMLASCGGGKTTSSSGASSSTPAPGEIIVNITDEMVAPFASEPITVKFWNPITGPDAEFLQNLVTTWNNRFGSKIEIVNDSLQEEDHYKRILTSFTDNSTADLCLIHGSRIPSYVRAGKMRDMKSVVSGAGIDSTDYINSIWDSCVMDNKLYGLCYDLLPTLLYYNKKLIPEGYTEDMIKSDDFTLDQMIEMMKLAYVDAPLSSKKKYGISFNYAYTESPFLSFLAQQGKSPVSADAPTIPTYNCQEGYDSADAVKSLPFTVNKDGKKVASESGADHLNVFAQGRALFTIDGIWSTNSAVIHNDRVDTGMAYLPKIKSSASKAAQSDSHVFSFFNNKYVSDHKDAGMGLFLKYMSDNTAYWCKGGKVAPRKSVATDAEYQKLEWSFPSLSLEKCIMPVKVYTYDTITNPIGEYVSKLCEGTLTDTKSAIDQCAKDAKEAAEKL